MYKQFVLHWRIYAFYCIETSWAKVMKNPNWSSMESNIGKSSPGNRTVIVVGRKTFSLKTLLDPIIWARECKSSYHWNYCQMYWIHIVHYIDLYFYAFLCWSIVTREWKQQTCMNDIKTSWKSSYWNFCQMYSFNYIYFFYL